MAVFCPICINAPVHGFCRIKSSSGFWMLVQVNHMTRHEAGGSCVCCLAHPSRWQSMLCIALIDLPLESSSVRAPEWWSPTLSLRPEGRGMKSTSRTSHLSSLLPSLLGRECSCTSSIQSSSSLCNGQLSQLSKLLGEPVALLQYEPGIHGSR